VVVDTKFFIQFSADETGQELFMYEVKWTNGRVLIYSTERHKCVLRIYYNYIMLTSDEWVPATTAWRVLRLRMEEGPPICRVAANIINKQSRTTDKGWSSSLGVGRGADNSSP
jgi:hypothetical protein